MTDEKILMHEAATLYYEKNKTQQEIAQILQLSRQTVSKLLGDAIDEKLVEIIIHDPRKDCEDLAARICQAFGIKNCVICSVSGKDESLHRTMTVKTAVNYILPVLQKGGLKIAVSWGRTIQELIHTLPETPTMGNTVFPLFGATDNEHSYFSSNEMARHLADKLDAELKCAWFPYMPDNTDDYNLLKQLSYYKKMQGMWDTADLAIMGIGNTDILEVFGKTFGYSKTHGQAIGDVATNFFDESGQFVDLYENTLCATVENIKNARESIAVACGKDKVRAIAGALCTKMIDTLITDEHTARKVIQLQEATQQAMR